jgi:hypothetical protein
MKATFDKVCLACRRDDGLVPLIRVEFRGATFWICPQHLPVLIHDPASLAGKLPGAENLAPADPQDD